MIETKPQQIQINSNQLDAFARLKVSLPTRLLYLTHTKGKNEAREYEINSGGGSAVANVNDSTINMSVIGGTDSITRQSRQYAIYQPARSLGIYVTTVLNSGSNANTVTSRAGYFDDENGIFLQYDGTNVSFVLRSSITGTPVDQIINQDSWNIDKFDGNGSSGQVLDITKAQIMFTDLEWLGVGIVRCGFVIGDSVCFAHFFFNSNVNVTTYMTTANLPIRYSLSTTGGSGSMKQICASVQSDGGYDQVGEKFSVNRSTTITAGTTPVPLVAIRLKTDTNAHRRTNIILDTISAIATGNEDSLFEVYINFATTSSNNPLTGGSFVSVDADSAIEANISATAFTSTNSRKILSIFSSDNANQLGEIANGLVSLSTNIDGSASDILTLTVQTITGTGAYVGGANWEEVY